MSVGADGVYVEEIGHGELAKAEFKAAARQFFEQREITPLVFDFILAQGKDFVNHGAPEVRRFAQQRIADDVEVRIAGKTETGAECSSASLFDIDQKLGGIVEAHSGVERHDAGSGFFIVGTQTVRAAIGGMERRMSLENEVRLPGEPETCVLEMGKHCFGVVSRRRIGRVGCGLGDGLRLSGGKRVWLLRQGEWRDEDSD